jgi:multidrug efflux pump subunit AcrA (membrane-fusion protein)
MAIKEEIMSDDNQIIQEEQQVDTVLNEEQVEQVVDSADELAEKVKTLEQELQKTQRNLEAARRGEKHNKQAKEQAVEQVRAEIEATYKEQLEQLQKQVNAFQLEKKNSQLISELDKAGAVDSTALIKLIGETDDVVKSVNELKTKHPSLFKSVQIPETQRSAEGFTSAGYAEELQSARNKYLKTGDRSEIDAVNKKYGVKTF